MSVCQRRFKVLFIRGELLQLIHLIGRFNTDLLRAQLFEPVSYGTVTPNPIPFLGLVNCQCTRFNVIETCCLND